MRTAEFDRKSWHCQLAHFGGLHDYEDDTDICRYLRAVAKGLIGGAFLLCLLTVISGVFAWIISDLCAWLACCFVFGYVEPYTGAIGALLALTISVGAGLFYGIGKIAKAGASAANDTFIGDAVDSMKNRMCFRVRIR